MEKQMNLIKVYTIVVSPGGRERERERVMPDESFTGLFSPTLIIVSIQFSINDVL